MKSKLLISSWLSGVPTLYLGDCASPAVGAARSISVASSLAEHRIVYAPIARHPPGLHAIGVNGALGFLRLLFGEAPVLEQLGARGLNLAELVGATRHQHRLLSVPSPVEREPGMGARNHWPLQLGFLPGLAAVGGHVDLLDHAAAGPDQSGDLHISLAGHLQPGRGPRDHGFRPELEMIPARLAADIGPRDRVVHGFV